MVIYKSLLNPIKSLFVAGSKPPTSHYYWQHSTPPTWDKVWINPTKKGIRRSPTATTKKKQKNGALEVSDVGYPKHELLTYNYVY